ncbi:hypothetical protein KSP39_PZI002796 [Platanthera zijinensis]|uniref:CWF19-like protein 2 n=1 Tax=Platanthera zijinensis TaxID=2320716 RepID=A0AAP0BZD5_9ASPA
MKSRVTTSHSDKNLCFSTAATNHKMLSGIKLIPREELLEEDSLSTHNRMKTRKEKHRHSSSDEDDDLKRDEWLAQKSKKKRPSRAWNCSDSDSSSSERKSKSYSDEEDKSSKSGKKRNAKNGRKKRDKESRRRRDQSSTLNGKIGSDNDNGILRKEMGLEWMLQPGSSLCNEPAPVLNDQESLVAEERKKMNPKELNPYLEDNGCGYPNDASTTTVPNQLLSSSLVGDGGASWRLKALKRAKEQAAREGRTLREVVGERWDSLQELATSVAVHRSAPSHAHLHAIKERKRGQANFTENQDKILYNSDYIKDASSGHSEMKKPKQDNLQWRSKHFKRIPLEDSLVSEAISSINKFSNDGSFMDSINLQKKDADVHHNSFSDKGPKAFCNNDLGSDTRDCSETLSAKRPVLSSNQLAAKVLHLKMKGKHEEAENLSVS